METYIYSLKTGRFHKREFSLSWVKVANKSALLNGLVITMKTPSCDSKLETRNLLLPIKPDVLFLQLHQHCVVSSIIKPVSFI